MSRHPKHHVKPPEKQPENPIEHRLEHEIRELRRIIEERDERIERILTLILQRLTPIARSAEGHFVNEEGEILMPARIQVGGKGASFAFTEFSGPNGTGSVVPPSGPITYASDDETVATVDSTGQVTAVGPGSCNISGLDPASKNSVTASDALTVDPAGPPPPVDAVSATGVLTANT